MRHDTKDATIADLFDEQVARTPNRLAMVQEGRTVTYREVADRVRRLGTALNAAGAEAGDHVGVIADPAIESVIAFLAAVRVGAAFVPIDARSPAVRQDQVLRDADVTLLVGPPADPANANDVAIHRIRRDCARQPPARTSRADAPPHGEYCCLLYTSGTTGAPKGVRVSSRMLVNYFRWMSDEWRFNDSDVALAYRPGTVIGSLWDYFGPLLQGVPVVIAGAAGHSDPGVVLATAADWSVTHASGVASWWRTLLAQPAAHLQAWKTLRLGLTMGERLHVDVLRAWRRAFGKARLLNVYGMTECWRAAACDVTDWEADSDYAPVGGPIAGASITLVDDGGHEVPIGEVGRICVAGPCVSEGYLNAAELTGARFHSMSGPRGDTTKNFLTGDVGRWRPDGLLEIVGRVDEQIKVLGHRVEPGDIEAALLRHPSVRQAGVVFKSVAPNESQLVAYIVPAFGTTPSSADLRTHLQRVLPAHMIPARYVSVDALPATASGKVDRRALREQVLETSKTCASSGPSSESLISTLVADVLAVPDVHADDNFLQLGGQSLTAIQLIVRVFDTCGVELDLAVLFDGETTVRDLAAHVDRLQREQAVDQVQTAVAP